MSVRAADVLWLENNVDAEAVRDTFRNQCCVCPKKKKNHNVIYLVPCHDTLTITLSCDVLGNK